MNKQQFPGQEYTFTFKKTGETETIVLPDIGVSNDQVFWNKASKCWVHRRFLCYRRGRQYKRLRKQIPGQEYTFIHGRHGETDTGILPSAYGLSNDFALWDSDDRKTSNGGCWRSHKFRNQNYAHFKSGLGPGGLLSRMKAIYWTINWTSKQRGEALLSVSPEEMLEQWKEQNGMCAACKGPGLGLYNHGSAYDHNHKTGEGRGFIHQCCNSAEGHLKDLSDEAFLHFVKWMRPHLFVDKQQTLE